MSTPPWAKSHCHFPQHQFRHVVERVDRPSSSSAEIVTAFTDGVVTRRSNRRTEGYHEAASTDGYKGVWNGDLVIHGLDILKGSVGVSDSDGLISSVCTVCLPRGGRDGRFLAYCIRAQAWSGYTRALARGVREGGADFRRWDTLGELRVPDPSLTTQRAIADFLDAETARIDALIAKKRRMIELLEERRLSALYQALRSQHWSLTRLKYVATLSAGGTPDTEDPRNWSEEGEGVPWIAITDMTRAPLVVLTARKVTAEGLSAKRLPVGKPGMTLFAMYASVGAVAELGCEASWNQAILGITAIPGAALDDFVRYWLLSLKPDLPVLFRSNTQDNLNADQVANLSFPVVDLDSQRAIVQQLDRNFSSIFLLTSRLLAQVDVLQERRQALITAAVTGEMKVPNAA